MARSGWRLYRSLDFDLYRYDTLNNHGVIRKMKTLADARSGHLAEIADIAG
jgi:hypothetical protein